MLAQSLVLSLLLRSKDLPASAPRVLGAEPWVQDAMGGGIELGLDCFNCFECNVEAMIG